MNNPNQAVLDEYMETIIEGIFSIILAAQPDLDIKKTYRTSFVMLMYMVQTKTFRTEVL